MSIFANAQPESNLEQAHASATADILDYLYSSDEEDYEPEDMGGDEARQDVHDGHDDEQDNEHNDEHDNEHDSDGSENGLLDWQEKILDEMEKSLEYPAEAEEWQGRKLVTIPKDEANEIRTSLWKHGPLKFIHHYCIEDTSKSGAELLAALGIRLPLDVVEQYADEQLRLFLQVAIKFALSKRQRLEYPRTVEEVCDVLDKAQNVIVLTGAGISTSLGIPDFRSDNGLYARLAHLGLNDPQEVFDIQLFREDPSVFYSIAKDVLPATTKFSPTHAFIKLLQDKGKLLRNYTQNIDNLEACAGVDPEKLVQCHGSFATATCLTCRRRVPGEEIHDDIRAGRIPKCPDCSQRKPAAKTANKSAGSDDDDDEPDEDPAYGVMKPDITFFGEPLPSRFEELLLGGDARKCDLLICLGTSLKVAPVSEIVRVLPPSVPQIYVSKTPVNHNEFDVTFLGNCDDAVELITEKMGWPLEHEMAIRPKTPTPAATPGTPVSNEIFVPGAKVVYEPDASIYRFIYGDTPSETTTPVEQANGVPPSEDHV